MNVANVVGGAAPPGGALPAGAPLALGPATNIHQTYHDLYTDPSWDPLAGEYATLYRDFTAAGTTPAALRDNLYNSANTGGLIHLLAHVRDANAVPADPGYIVGYHRLTRHVAGFGQGGRPFDGQGHAFMGDVINGQVPITVGVPDTLFNMLPAVQVPTSGLMDQLLLADPVTHVVGPFAAGDPDITAVTTRGVMVVPNPYILPFMTTGMRPRDAYQAVLGMVQQNHHEAACAPLLDWLRVPLPRRTANALPRTTTTPLVAPMYAPPEMHQLYLKYRMAIAHRDLPLLSPAGTQQGAQLIATGLTTLVQEQRLARQEAAEQRRERDARKTPADYYGVLLERLMRWAQVHGEDDLPPIHEALSNTKKGKIRALLQKTVEDCLSNNGFVEEFPVTTAMATKIIELNWHTSLPDDFSCGLNLFAVGALDDEAIEVQRTLNHQADLLLANEGTAPLDDLATVSTPKGDVSLPHTFAQLRYQVQRMYALWSTLLAPEHPLAIQYYKFQQQLVRREKFLETVETSDRTRRYMVPALVGRWVQLRTNLWLQAQARTNEPLPVTDFQALFDHMALMEPWEPRFPPRYFTPLVMKDSPTTITGHTDTLSGMSTLTPGTTGLTPSNSSTVKRSTAVRSATYNEAFQKFKSLGIRTSTLRERLKEKKIEPPRNTKGEEMCLAWHVVGMCNTGCKRSPSHGPQSAEDDAALLAWCNDHYTLSA
mmetsp:Transcript_6869/g.13921  ORF Transcript_6869/g.13921 Transcript_6869/m.13921 type:complete len:711 (+) Transcript_6869:32-2164(+)